MRNNDIETLRRAFSYTKRVEGKSIEDKETFYWIVKNPAYTDFTPRTIKGVSKDDVCVALDQLAEAVWEYIHGRVEDFEKWHNITSNQFLEDYKRCSGTTIKYGKAQKILNMTMKYLFCLPDSNKYAQKFKGCHMPIDSYIINWFCEYVIPQINNKDENGIANISVGKLKDTSWSNLECGSSQKEYTYLWLQDQLKQYFSSDANIKYRNAEGETLTPFEAEFYIWPEQQFVQSYRGKLSSGVFATDYPEIQDENIEEICNNLINALENLRRKVKVMENSK